MIATTEIENENMLVRNKIMTNKINNKS